MTGRARQWLLAGFLTGVVAIAATCEGQAQPKVYDLRTAVEIALANHPGLATADLRAQAAKTGVALAGAQYRPTLDAVATAERVLAGDKTQVIGDTSVSQTVPAEQVFSGALNLNVPLVREGRLVWVTLPSEEAAAARYEAVKNQMLLTRADVVGTVSVTFFTALTAGEDVKVSEQLVELNRVLLDSARLKFEQQLIPQSEVKAAEAGLASAEADLAVARANLTRSLSNFLTSMGLDASPEAVEGTELLDRDGTPAPAESLADLVKQAASTHPSIVAQEANVKQAELAYRVLETERYPRLDFSTRLGGADTSSSKGSTSGGGTTDTQTDFWSLRAMLQLNWRLWDFGLLGLKLKQQRETIQAERSALAEARSKVTKSVVEAYQTLNNAQSKLSAAEKALDLAEELGRVARERFQQNLIPQSEVMQAEAKLAAARKALIQAQYAVRIDQALLRIAMGTETS